MARKPLPIPPKAMEAWKAGDVPAAERLSKLRERRLRDRLGPPGQGSPRAAPVPPQAHPLATPPADAATGAPATPALPSQADPRRGAILAAVGRALDAEPALLELEPDEVAARIAEPDPTDEEIAAVDTRQVAARMLIRLERRFGRASDVRAGALGGRVLDAANRLEQIDLRRPKPPTPDAVHEAIRQAMGESTDHLLRHTVLAAERWAKLLPRLRVTLGIAAPELLRELGTLTGGATA